MDEALSLLQKAVQGSPQNAQAHYYLGRVLEDIAQHDRPLSERSLKCKPQSSCNRISPRPKPSSV